MGTSLSSFLQIIAALGFVVGLMALLGFAIRRWGAHLGLPVMAPLARNRRLQIVEMLPLDNRNKLVIFRRDNVHHTVLIGPSSTTIIEQNIPAQKPTETP
jgi:flagellar biogenesis protein FliO